MLLLNYYIVCNTHTTIYIYIMTLKKLSSHLTSGRKSCGLVDAIPVLFKLLLQSLQLLEAAFVDLKRFTRNSNSIAR